MNVCRMTTLCVLLMFLAAVAALAAKPKAKPVNDYQEAVLISFNTVADGTGCYSTGNVNGTTNTSGTVTGTGSAVSTCGASETQLYIVRVGSNLYTLRPTISGKRAAGEAALVIGTIGYGALFLRNRAVLSNQLPGAHILLRPHGDGVEVKVGKKSSLYDIVAAR